MGIDESEATTVDHDARRLSFGPAAQAYDRIRPTYPREAVAWALGAHSGRVVDLGAGTGLMTRVLLDVADEVVPVEPDAGMRAQLEASTPGVRALAGAAEVIPLSDASVDAVIAGQAYHWFDHGKAHTEIARVLRPGGVLAPIWNIRDESVEWVAQLTEAFEGRQVKAHEGQMAEAEFGPLFGPVEAAQFPMAVPMTGDDVVALMESRSYFLTAPARERAVMSQRVREITAELGDCFDMPYVTYAYRAARL
jgi:SAM-dependent methyltransferase